MAISRKIKPEVVHDPLWELGGFKEMLCYLFMDNKEITDLVMPVLDDADFTFEENWIGGIHTKTVSGEQRKVNLQGYCLTVPFMEGVVSSAKTFIAMETTCDSITGKNTMDISLQVYVYAHRDSVRLSNEEKQKYHAMGYAGNRCDVIAMAINRTLLNDNIKKSFGIGDLSLDNNSRSRPVGTHIPNNNYYGRVLSYTVPDFYVTSETRRKFVNAGRS